MANEKLLSALISRLASREMTSLVFLTISSSASFVLLGFVSDIDKYWWIPIIGILFPVLGLAFNEVSRLTIHKHDQELIRKIIKEDRETTYKSEEAIQIFEKILELDPQNADALTWKGYALIQSGQSWAAKSPFLSALQIEPNHANATFGLGDMYLDLEDYPTAEEYYRKGLEINPEDALGWSGLGLSLTYRGNESGLIYHDKAIAISPDDPLILAEKGDSYYNLGKLEEAITYYDKALELEPNDVMVLGGKAYIFFEMEQFEKAIKVYDKILELDPNDSWALNEKGRNLFAMEKYEEALPYFEKSLEIDPNNQFAKNNIKLVNQKFSEQREISKEEVNVSLKKVFDLMNKAQISSQNGDDNTARNYLRQATTIVEEEIEPSIMDPQAKADLKRQINLLKEQLGMSTKSSGGCLIATATFGSELSSEVQQLRELRDNHLLQTESGSAFMIGFNELYYSFSPTIADLERENLVFKEIVKLTITPLLTSLSILNYVNLDSEEEVLGYGIGVILLNIGMYFVAPAILFLKLKKMRIK